MHSMVYTPGGRDKRQETMLCSVTTPKLIKSGYLSDLGNQQK
jgi:hypothetical protein